MIINKVNIDKWLFDYFEGNLSTHEKMEIERFIEANPKFEIDLDSWEDSYDLAQEVPVYSISSNLYKQSFFITNKYLIAGLLLLMFSLSGIVYYNVNEGEKAKIRLTNLSNEQQQQQNKTIDALTQTREHNLLNPFSDNDKQVQTKEVEQESRKIVLILKDKTLGFENNLVNKEKNKNNHLETGNKTSKLLNSSSSSSSRANKKINHLRRNNQMKTSKVNKELEVSKLEDKKRKDNPVLLNLKAKHKNTRVKSRKIRELKTIEIDKTIVKLYKTFKKEDLTKQYKYLSYNRVERNGFESNQKKKHKQKALKKSEDKIDRKLEYFDNIAIIGVLFDSKGKVNKKRKTSLIDKLKTKELALVNTHDPLFVTNTANPIANNVALVGGLNRTRFKINATDRWRGTLNSRVGGVFTADTYLQKLNAGIGLVAETKNFSELGVYSTELGIVYSQRVEISENKSVSLGAKYHYTTSVFKAEKLEGLDGSFEVELEQNKSFLMTENQQKSTKNQQNNLSFGAWYDGSYFYGGINLENINIKKSENNNANQFVEYINPVKFAVQLGTDYRRNAYSALIISPQLNYSYQNLKSEFWLGSTLKYKGFITGIGGSTGKSFKVNIGAQGDKMRLIYGFNYAKSIAEAKFKEMHEISFRYILRSKNNWKK